MIIAERKKSENVMTLSSLFSPSSFLPPQPINISWDLLNNYNFICIYIYNLFYIYVYLCIYICLCSLKKTFKSWNCRYMLNLLWTVSYYLFKKCLLGTKVKTYLLILYLYNFSYAAGNKTLNGLWSWDSVTLKPFSPLRRLIFVFSKTMFC